MDVTPHELRTIELREAWRGYKQDEVDRLLDRVAGTIERLQAQVERLSERVSRAESEVGVGREADEMLRRTLLLAQRTADAAVAEAHERARRVLSESEAHAHSIVSSAEEEARRVAIAERQRVESEVRDLAGRRDLLLADVEALEAAARDHRRRLREFLEAEIARIDARPLPDAPERPQLADVDLAAFESPADPEAPDELAASEASQAMDETGAIEALEIEGFEIEGFEDDGLEGEGLEGEGLEDENVEALEVAEVWVPEPTEAGDLLPGRRRRWLSREVEPELDPPDDRFFDELRQAVRDETPLGPRDDLDDDAAVADADAETGDDEYASQGSASFDQDDRRSRT